MSGSTDPIIPHQPLPSNSATLTAAREDKTENKNASESEAANSHERKELALIWPDHTHDPDPLLEMIGLAKGKDAIEYTTDFRQCLVLKQTLSVGDKHYIVERRKVRIEKSPETWQGVV